MESDVFNNKGEGKVFCNTIGYQERGQKGCKQMLRVSKAEGVKIDVNGFKRNEFFREFYYYVF